MSKKRILKLAVGFLGVAIVVISMIYSHREAQAGDAFKVADSVLRASHVVSEKIGQVKETKLAFTGYSIKIHGSSGTASLNIYLAGDRGNAKAAVKLEMAAGVWRWNVGDLFLDEKGIAFPIDDPFAR